MGLVIRRSDPLSFLLTLLLAEVSVVFMMDSDLFSCSENGEFAFGPKDVRLDAKLAFGNVCTLLDLLEDNEENRKLFAKIKREAVVMLRKKREKRSGLGHSLLNDSIPNGAFRPPGFSRASANDSLRVLNNSTLVDQDSSKLLSTSTVSQRGFVPIQSKRGGGVELGTIPEADESQLNQIDDETPSTSCLSPNETIDEEPSVLLTRWSIKKVNNCLHLTGIRINRKGNILDENFSSEKIISRQSSNTIRTKDGDIILKERISDHDQSIPEEVKEFFDREDFFPKNWRKVLDLWNNLETTKRKPKKRSIGDDNSIPNKARKKRNSDSTGKTPDINKKNTPKGEQNSNQKSSKKPTPKNPTPKEPRRQTPKSQTSKNPTPKESKKPTPKNSKSNNSKPGPEPKKRGPKGNKKDVGEKKPRGRPKVPKEDDETISEQNISSEILDENELRKKKMKEILGLSDEDFESNNNDDDDQEIPGLDGEPEFNLAGSVSSLTPTGLLGSLKKQSIRGHITPPTDVFAELFGNKPFSCASADSSLINSSDKIPRPKPAKEVIARLQRAKSKANAQKYKGRDYCPKKYEHENEALIANVMGALNMETTHTPSIVKKVFRGSGSFSEDDSDQDF